MARTTLEEVKRVLDTDLSVVLQALNQPDVNEVMLNPYERDDGNMEGHLWFEQAGIGMTQLKNYSPLITIEHNKPEIGDYVLYKLDDNSNVVNYSIISSEATKATILQTLSDLIRYSFAYVQESDQTITFLDQTENYKLNVLCNYLLKDKLSYTDADLALTYNLNDLIELINPSLQDYFLSIDVLEIDETSLSDFCEQAKYKRNFEYIKLSETKALQIMQVLASYNDKHFHDKEPTLECAIPFYHHRFAGARTPAAPFPTFSIRKHSSKIITLNDYVKFGTMDESTANHIRSMINRKLNILIAGGVSSGKTTLLNACLHELRHSTDRIGIIEDTPEIKCSVLNHFKYQTTNERTIQDLLRLTLRSRPDRIVVGELRGGEAYQLMKAWLTGHPGGLATIHANSVKDAISMFENYVREAITNDKLPKEQIGSAINAIISVQRNTTMVVKNGQIYAETKRMITGVSEIGAWDPKHQVYSWLHLFIADTAVLEKE